MNVCEGERLYESANSTNSLSVIEQRQKKKRLLIFPSCQFGSKQTGREETETMVLKLISVVFLDIWYISDLDLFFLCFLTI